MPAWFWFVVAGVGAGLVLAYLVDNVAARLKRSRPADRSITAHFSPRGGCTDILVGEIAAAKKEVLVQAYSFTAKPIGEALKAAAKRGARVIVLLDRSNEADHRSELGDLREHGIEMFVDHEHAIAHNKIMLIDQHTIVTGSFNFTNQAELENAENLLVLRNYLDLMAAYRANFLSHHGHCKAPGAVAAPPAPPPAHPGAPPTTATHYGHSRHAA